MKKLFALTLAAVMALSLTACSMGGNSSSSSSSTSSSESSSSMELSTTLKEGTKLQDILTGVHTDFGEFGAIAMPDLLTEAMLKDQYGLTADDYEDFYGEYSMSITNSDHLIVIKSKPGKIGSVQTSLEKRKQDLEKQFEQYPVNGSYDRAKAAEVYVRGDYAFLIAVGHLPEDPEADPEFPKQIKKARDVIDSYFA